jgi:ADP-ribosylglycohydrolase
LVGDALGVPYEFQTPMDAVAVRFGARGTWDQPPGTWSDDGALMLALLDSLLTRAFDTTDQAKRALAWYREGRYAPGGHVFDVGRTTRRAMEALESGESAEEAGPTDEQSCGNGSLMRILPLALVRRSVTATELVREAHKASAVTHGHARAQVCCALYVLVARRLLHGVRRRGALAASSAELRGIYSSGEFDPRYLAALDELEGWDRRSGAGYVLDSFWSAWDAFDGARSYEEAVTAAVAYGNDTDTTAAITGGLAGIHWGIGGIPGEWLNRMRDPQIVEPFVDRLQVSTGEQYTVYVIKLTDEAWAADPALRKRNPKRSRAKPCVYVGQTAKMPEDRFADHKAGKLDAPIVRDHGVELLPELYADVPIAQSREEAERLEGEHAIYLRQRGYAVWEGRLGPLRLNV